MKQLSEKLTDLRRREGLSQEQLADRLGVTRQSVSKWESGTAVPELGKLVALSELFGVSVDYLVKTQMEEPVPLQQDGTARLEEKIDTLARQYNRSYYRYTSPIRVFGLPLVSIRFGRARTPTRETLAVGIVAIGNFSVGVVSLGLISLGGLSLGMVAFGGLAAGMVAVGYLALGVSVLGVYGAGVAVHSLNIAVGTAASGATAVGRDAAGANVLLAGQGVTAGQVESFLLEHHPNLWRPLARLLAFFGGHL